MNYRKITAGTLLASSLVLLALVPGRLASSQSPGRQSAPAAQSSTPIKALSPVAKDALTTLQSAAKGEVVTQQSRQTGVYTFVRTEGGEPLVADDASATPQKRALSFLSNHGGLVGLNEAERAAVAAGTAPSTGSELRIAAAQTDAIGMQQVKLNQFYRGLKVFGAQLIVTMNSEGVRVVNGNYVPDISLSAIPAVDETRARDIAAGTLRKSEGAADARAEKAELSIYPLGLLEGTPVRSVLAYAVDVKSGDHDEQIWIDAQTGSILNRISHNHSALNRRVYTPSYDPANPESNVVRKEGDLVAPAPSDPASNLYHYTGHSYNFFASLFGRDSYDGIGQKPQRTVLLVSEACPNAYWQPSTETTNYCPDFDKDDIVAHEWGHAYTTFTDDLIYSYQSGALNEHYSDIVGETIDLFNGTDGIGGANNNAPTTYTVQNGQYIPNPPDPLNGVRWRIGEDLTGLSQPVVLGISRDMWTPQAYQDPEKVSSDLYHCDASDSGGVHTNSGVPNHAFAMLVDGKTFNGVTVAPIGFVRAHNIYWRAKTAYQTPSTTFAQHEQALQSACRDMIGVPLTKMSTSSGAREPSPDVITIETCGEVAKAMQAVEMSRDVFATCNFKKLLDPNTPAECSGASVIFSEDWESGVDGWAVGNKGTGANWPGTNWTPNSTLPANEDGSARSGTAMFAPNPRIGEPNGGTCAEGGMVSGQFWMDSPPISVPAGASDMKMAFDHFVQTEPEFDGGNVKIKVNDGEFTEVPKDQYIFNPPNFTAPTGMPLAGQQIWNGVNEGELDGSWGTTIINLANLAKPGDVIQIRYEFGQDDCNGSLGWFVDNIRVYNCPVLAAPTLEVGAGYENPDTDGAYTMTWTRPPGATGPDTLQESTTCGPVFTDDASEPLVAGSNSKWQGSAQWTSQPNPSNANNQAYYIPNGAVQNESLTMKNAINVPQGGSSTLTFTTRQGFEDTYDFGRVEVSTDNGATFKEVAAYTGPDAIDPLTVFAGVRTVDLSPFAGQSIKVRFRVTSDPYTVGAPAGWHIDNITITASAFTDVATVLGTSFNVTGRGTGSYCYRVRSTYDFAGQKAQSPFSDLASLTVAEGVVAANPSRLQNLAARSRVQSGERVLISGFIIGDATKRVIIRAIGPSLESGGAPVAGRMENPTLELYAQDSNTPIATNDNWEENGPQVQQTGLAPKNSLESAIVTTLNPGAYTAVVRGQNGGTGIALVEVYELDAAGSTLANLSARAFVETGDNVLIGGLISGPGTGAPLNAVVRALGPSLKSQLADALNDTTLELVDANGNATVNDNWRESPRAAEIEGAGLAPTNDAESALLAGNLAPGLYTVIVRGKGDTQGTGVVEIYHLR